MTIWAIADLHLSFGIPNKKMDVFGPLWVNHAEKIAQSWKNNVLADDLVLLAGDISWATNLSQVKADLDWIEQLPGTKIMIRGNHDYWWHSISKVREILPPSCHAIQNDAFQWNNISIGGARLWDTDEFDFNEFTDYRRPEPSQKEKDEEKRIFARDLARLELSLKELDQKAEKRIVMTHYPPIGPKLMTSQVSLLLEEYHADIVVFGHLHNMKKDRPLFSGTSKIQYYLTACDYLDFQLLKIL